MAAAVFFTGSDELAELAVVFTVASVPTDPDTISCVVTDPNAVAVTHTYLGASPSDITRTNA